MDFGFSDEQEMLRQTARSFLDENCPSAVVRQLMEDDRGYDPNLWKEMADLGGAVYGSTKENPKSDPKVKKIMGSIKKMESQISKLEKMKGPTKKKAKKKTARKKTAKKKSA